MSASIAQLARQVTTGQRTAVELAEEALARAQGDTCNALTDVLPERALAEARAVDQAVAQGQAVGPLAGVPYVVKNLFAIKDVVRRAGTRLPLAPAVADAALVARLQAAGAVLIGAANMDELAYGFVTENAHAGAVHNPLRHGHIAGGSSGGSAAAVAGGIVPFALGSDTNGSIRVPAALCGLFGLRPTYGRLSRAGTQLFAASLDTVGPLVRTPDDLATLLAVLEGQDAADPVSMPVPVAQPSWQTEPRRPLRLAVVSGYCRQHADGPAWTALQHAAAALGVSAEITIPSLEQARAIAYVLTASEGGNLHRQTLAEHGALLDPQVYPRLLAGLCAPASWYLDAQRLRGAFCAAMQQVFQDVDVLLAPAVPVPAPPIGQATIGINGTEQPTRAAMGLLTQPFSLAGLPAAVAPLWPEGGLPVGVQCIAPPWQDHWCLQVLQDLQAAGLTQPPA